MCFLGPDHRDGYQGDAHFDRDTHHTTPAEALQPIPLAEDLARALQALGKGHHRAARAQQSIGVLTAGPYATEACQVGLHEGKGDQPVRHQKARSAALRYRFRHHMGDHQAVIGKDSGAVRHQQYGAFAGKLLDARDIHPPVVAAQVLQHGTRVADGLLIQSEIVDVTGPLGHPQGRDAAAQLVDECHPACGTPCPGIADCDLRIEARVDLLAQIEKGVGEEITALPIRIFPVAVAPSLRGGLVGRVDVGTFSHLLEPQR